MASRASSKCPFLLLSLGPEGSGFYSGAPRVLEGNPGRAPHHPWSHEAPSTCWVEEALEEDDITINLVGGGDG